jgi:hypothetical protein
MRARAVRSKREKKVETRRVEVGLTARPKVLERYVPAITTSPSGLSLPKYIACQSVD